MAVGFIGASTEFIILALLSAVVLLWLYLYLFRYGKVNKGLFDILKRKRKKVEDPLLTLKNFFLDNLITFQGKLNNENKKGIFKEFTLIVRKFFADFYKINYRFTYDELIKEIEKMKIRDKDTVIKFLKELSRIGYSGYEPSLSEIKHLLLESRNIVNILTSSEKLIGERPMIKMISRTKKQPFLTKNIPDQAWERGGRVSGLNLNDFFSGENLSYKVLQPSYIKIDIEKGIVTFRSDPGFSGVKYTVFLASNKYGESCSNIVNLKVSE
jgi:hypothetical protein